MSSITSITEALTGVVGWFTTVVTTISDPDIMQWVVIGIGVSVLGVSAKFFRRLVWGI